MSLPDFFVIGAPKAGTTALHAALARHPDLYLSRVKEPKYFLCDGTRPARREHRGPGDAHSAREWVWQRDRYEDLFSAAPAGTLRGESTPFYLYDHDAPLRIREAVPTARLIAIVRDPVDRAYSNWMHLWSDGLEPISRFVDAMTAEDARVTAGWAPFWHYRRLGMYGRQLERLYSVFPPEQVLVLRYRRLVDEPARTLDAVSDFLGIPRHRAAQSRPANVKPFVLASARNAVLARAVRGGSAVGSHLPPQVWRTASRPLVRLLRGGGVSRPVLSVPDRRAVLEHFTDDIALLGSLTGDSYADCAGRLRVRAGRLTGLLELRHLLAAAVHQRWHLRSLDDLRRDLPAGPRRPAARPRRGGGGLLRHGG